MSIKSLVAVKRALVKPVDMPRYVFYIVLLFSNIIVVRIVDKLFDTSESSPALFISKKVENRGQIYSNSDKNIKQQEQLDAPDVAKEKTRKRIKSDH